MGPMTHRKIPRVAIDQTPDISGQNFPLFIGNMPITKFDAAFAWLLLLISALFDGYSLVFVQLRKGAEFDLTLLMELRFCLS